NTATPAGTISGFGGTRADLSYWNGSTLYYNPAATGTVTFRNYASDPGSGVATFGFPALAATGFTGSARTSATGAFTSFEDGLSKQVVGGTTVPTAAADN